MATPVKSRPANLHASDSYLWALSQQTLRVTGLRISIFAQFAEDLEGLAIATRSAVRWRARTILEYLTLQHPPATDPCHGWRRTVACSAVRRATT